MTSDPVARYLATKGQTLQRRERLRTLSSGEVFSTALRVYRQLGWFCMRLSMAPTAFCLASFAFLFRYVLPLLLNTNHPGSVRDQLGEAAFSLFLAVSVGGPLFLLGFTYICALGVQLCSVYMLGESLPQETLVQNTRQKFLSLLQVIGRQLVLGTVGIGLGALVLGLGAYLSSRGVAAGDILFFLGGVGIAIGVGWFIYNLCIYSLAPAVVFLEGGGAAAASRRSRFLLRAQLNHPSGSLHLVACLFWIAFAALVEWSGLTMILQILQLGEHLSGLEGFQFAGLFIEIASLIIPFIVLWTLLPIYAICITLVYYERRIRLEGLDIEILAAEADRPGASNRFDV